MVNPIKLLLEIRDILIDLGIHISKKKDFNLVESDPRKVIENIFNKGIKWFDYNELSDEKKRNYFRDCQLALNSDAINNIRNYLIAQITQQCLKEHNPEDGLDKIRDAQMTINGIELFIQELGSIPNPDDQKEKPFKNDDLRKFEAT